MVKVYDAAGNVIETHDTRAISKSREADPAFKKQKTSINRALMNARPSASASKLPLVRAYWLNSI